MNRISKALLVFTSFAPIILTYSFILFIKKSKLSEIVPLLIIVLLMTIICLSVLHYAKRHLEIQSFKINSIKTADGEVLGFLIAYILPVLSLTNPNIDFRIIGFVIILFFTIIWTTNSYHINPLLSLFGYHFYEVTTLDNVTYLLLTKRELRKTASLKEVVHITDYMVLDIMEG